MTAIAWYMLILTLVGFAVGVADIDKPREPMDASTMAWNFIFYLPIWYFLVRYLAMR